MASTLFNVVAKISKEEDNLQPAVSDIPLDNVMAPQDASDELNNPEVTEYEIFEREAKLRKDLESLEDDNAALDALDEQLKENREKLEDEEREVIFDDVKTSQEALNYSLVKLGYDQSDISTLRITHESLDNNYRNQLIVSTESVSEVIQRVFESISKLIISIGYKLKEYCYRMIITINNREKELIKYMEFCRKHDDILLPSLEKKDIDGICRRFNIFLGMYSDSLDVDEMIRFTTDVKRNPFLANINEFFNYYSSNDYAANLDKLVKKVESVAASNPLQMKLKKFIRNKIIELQDPDSLLYTTYIRKSTIKGFVLHQDRLKYETYTRPYVDIRPNFSLGGATKFGELQTKIKSVMKATNGLSSYFKHLLFLQSNSLRDLKNAYKKYNYDQSSVENAVIKNTMQMIQDIGTNMIYDLILQQYYMIKDLCYVFETYIVTYNRKVAKDRF